MKNRNPNLQPGSSPPKSRGVSKVHSAPVFRLNRVIGWTSLMMGALMGLILGLWSFDGPLPSPAWIGGYGDVSRRLLRLAHIAFFGLGILNLLMTNEARRWQGLTPSPVIAALMNIGNLLLPVTLIAAAAFPPFKYLLPVPALCIFAALGGMTYGVWNHEYRMR